MNCYLFSCFFFSHLSTVTFYPVTFFPTCPLLLSFLLLFFLLLFFLPETVTFFPVTLFPVTFFPCTERRMSIMMSRITLKIDYLFNSLFRLTTKSKSKPRISVPLWGNPPTTGGFPSQRATNVENVSMSWRHHVQRDNSWTVHPRDSWSCTYIMHSLYCASGTTWLFLTSPRSAFRMAWRNWYDVNT